MDPSAPLVSVQNVVRSFGGVKALDGLSLDVFRGEFFALLGPSGCGKTTLMRAIAGFEAPDGGRVLLDGIDLGDTPPHKRPVNMVFQSYALFPHMSVERNIAFGLEREGLPRAEVAARVDEMLTLVQLGDERRRRPHQLSGGQKQRVALARALAKRPRLLLLDEPLAALDRKLREETQFELKRVQRRLGATFMLVTHDQDEAMTMADRIAVMRAGRVEQLGAGADVYNRPANRWVAGFVGEINLFEAAATADCAAGASCAFQLDVGLTTPPLRCGEAVAKSQRVAVAARPEHIALSRAAPDQPGPVGAVSDLAFRGDATLARIELPSGFVVRALLPNASVGGARFARGDRVALSLAAGAATVLTS